MGSGSSSSVKPNFKNGKPTMDGNFTPMYGGQVYRISDIKNSRWGFYNDSDNLYFHVAVLFDYDCQITPLGNATAFRIDDPDDGDEDDYGKYLVEVDLAPGATEEFVEGVITGWKMDTLEGRTNKDERTYRL
ncbi:hypothetical protein AGDE_00130 [Angomonas deanei]|uniref:DUF1935 domain-containing protein n=1 Tax=Angomonas deanei TaxID=59799 RepID=S9VKW9_9TRYP|nr:hypothetical protein AGDE_02856 [Angomonas deanei]EPY43452.1 hypothetical protein AGDE_00469 [Angomonas deanei]EPY43791.1 hypothetical protein AGDE_00130 [Angomonas deanei]CAD2215187.1 Domain of unknown function (DUF1935), putative [Angomonas deanei]|eukprot:EPY41069.1 hypothetical protein AGDE_02856 [Angomonas deanei]